jgi:hypothetical protein
MSAKNKLFLLWIAQKTAAAAATTALKSTFVCLTTTFSRSSVVAFHIPCCFSNVIRNFSLTTFNGGSGHKNEFPFITTRVTAEKKRNEHEFEAAIIT